MTTTQPRRRRGSGRQLQITLYLPPDQVQRLDQDARLERLSRNDLIRRAIDVYYRRLARPPVTAPDTPEA